MDSEDRTLEEEEKLRQTQVNLVITPNGIKSLGSPKEGDYELAYGRTHRQDQNYIIETLVHFSHEAQKLIFEWICKTKDN